MKIVSYNVNGLRARIIPYKTLHAFLSALDADIICFQETKLSKQELTGDIATAEGYEAFFSCTRTVNKGKIGYSGVATFCRASITSCEPCTSGVLPLAADEGFTGLLHLSKRGEIEGVDRVGYYDNVLNMGMTQEELLQLDREGRCIVTDHGSFVLFNIYGPCVQPDDTARMDFKLKFYQVLQCRWESLLRAGKRLIVVGDLNISAYPIDSCNPGPHFNSNPCRKWLRSLLSTNGGLFTDVYRAVHGLKKGAYTCWSQASGAEEFNYGTRIDLILAAGSCMHTDVVSSVECKGFAHCSLKDCDIMLEFKRFKEDSTPRWSGGRSLKLEGSDHVPVFLLLNKQPLVKPHDVPTFAARFLPQLRGRQQSIYAILQKGDQSMNMVDISLHVDSEEGSVDKRSTRLLKVQATQKFKTKVVQKTSQTNLTAFFARSSGRNTVLMNETLDNGGVSGQSQEVRGSCSNAELHDEDSQVQYNFETSIQPDDSTNEYNCTDMNLESKLSPLKSMDANAKEKNAQAQWKRIKDLMARRIPLCRHGEPCVARIVKKSGPNHGRGFYVCARAEGPASNPEARCDHFEWASEKSRST
ncbi:hypothetical protein GOP47_0024680 [Adiantum capillus-veneris]|uniref:DNA-(apurinic or apyrimidinic site) endonuclease 2 n=1 Tax=Adiantum capillus-veneris TaxID=13818 RepID=A0A9D4U2K4_ADICA|nr:hypothetical protein GOP47_0024680 [Adiantum capillus-veneris]